MQTNQKQNIQKALTIGILVFVLAFGCSSPIQPTVAPYTPRPIKMVDIPAATYTEGSLPTTPYDNTPIGPPRCVTLSAFAIQETEVTQGQFKEIMGYNPSLNPQECYLENPVYLATWYDAILFCNKLSKKEHLDTVYRFTHQAYAIQWDHFYIATDTIYRCSLLVSLEIDYSKKGYRLPTEAEYEYACRGGTTTAFWWGDYNTIMDLSLADTCAWWAGNEPRFGMPDSRPVATKRANGFRLYDMAGNAREFCNDWFSPYDTTSQVNPVGPTTAQLDTGVYPQCLFGKVLRGGSYDDDVTLLQSAYRLTQDPSLADPSAGFRCAMTR